MKITIDFEDEPNTEPKIPLDAKLRIIRTVMRAAHNPVVFVTLEVKPFISSDKQ